MDRVPRLPALEDLWKAPAPAPLPDPPRPVRAGTVLIALPEPYAWIVNPGARLGRRARRRARRWFACQARLSALRGACVHPDLVRVLWADWSVTAVCAACGRHGNLLPVPAVGDTLVIPRDLEEFLAMTGMRSFRTGLSGIAP